MAFQEIENYWSRLTSRDLNVYQEIEGDKIEVPCLENTMAIKLPDEQKIPPTWEEVFEIGKANVDEIYKVYRSAHQEGLRVFPLAYQVFNAYWQTPLVATSNTRPWQRVRVVIVGQDPYHNWNEEINRPSAMGLAFSVPYGQPNVSLRNIFNELAREYKEFDINRSPNLTPWARQGVLLLNQSPVVYEGKPNDPRTKKIAAGLFQATVKAIQKANPNCVWVIWGREAEKAVTRVLGKDAKHVLYSNHPSGLSANRGKTPFIGNGHFRKINEILTSMGQEPIRWHY